MAYYVGLDWGGAGHAVCIIDDAGRVIERFEVRHNAEGIAELIRRLGRAAPAAEMPIAIERPSGLLVDSLVAAEYPIVPIHPNVVKACRPRYRAAGGKSDPGDSFMLADILRTDGHRFRRLTPCSDDIKALRALVRGRDDLVAQRRALANQLRALLDSFWPGAAVVFADIDSPIALAFVRRYPTPESAATIGRVGSTQRSDSIVSMPSPASMSFATPKRTALPRRSPIARRGVSIGALPRPDGIEPGSVCAGDPSIEIGNAGDHCRPGLGRCVLVGPVIATRVKA